MFTYVSIVTGSLPITLLLDRYSLEVVLFLCMQNYLVHHIVEAYMVCGRGSDKCFLVTLIHIYILLG